MTSNRVKALRVRYFLARADFRGRGIATALIAACVATGGARRAGVRAPPALRVARHAARFACRTLQRQRELPLRLDSSEAPA